MNKNLVCDIQLEGSTVKLKTKKQKYIKKVKEDPKPIIKSIIFDKIILSFD